METYNFYTAYDKKARYEYLIKKMLKGKVEAKHLSDSDAASKELISQIKKLVTLIDDEKHKLVCMQAVNSCEYTYVRDNLECTNKQLDRIYAKNRYIEKFVRSWFQEMKFGLAIIHSLEDFNVTGELESAIRYYIKAETKRFTDKTGPVQILLNENLLHCAYSGYATKLSREGIDVWEDLTSGKRDYHEVVKYVYDNKRLAFVYRRDKVFDAKEAKIAASNTEKKKASEQRKIDTAKRRVSAYVNLFSKYIAEPNAAYYIKGLRILFQKHPKGHIFLVITTKNSSVGYLQVDGRILKTVTNAQVFESYEKAKDSMSGQDFLEYSIVQVC